jgi:Flp pilus assembly CpaF family ATPase
MFKITITESGQASCTRDFDKPEVTIGRANVNDIVLVKNNVSKRHARILKEGHKLVVVDVASTNGTYVNGERIAAPYDLGKDDKIEVGDFTLEVSAHEDINYGLTQTVELSTIAKPTTTLFEALLKDPSVEQIFINGYKNVQIIRHSRTDALQHVFLTAEALNDALEQLILAPHTGIVVTTLADGSHLQAVFAPVVTEGGPILLINKPMNLPTDMDGLVAHEFLTAQMAEMLQACVTDRKNILVCGNSPEAQSALLEAMALFIKADERVLIFGSLSLPLPFGVRLQSNTLTDGLALRPRRLIINHSAIDRHQALQAMATTCHGSIVSMSALSPQEALSEIERDVSLPSMFAQAIQVVVHVMRFDDGSSRVIGIDEVIFAHNKITRRELFNAHGPLRDH